MNTVELELSTNKKAARYWDLTVKTLSHVIKINICPFRLTEQGLFTHLGVPPRAVSSARLRVRRMVQGTQHTKLPMPAVNKYQEKTSRVPPTPFLSGREVFVSFSLAPHSLLFHIILE